MAEKQNRTVEFGLKDQPENTKISQEPVVLPIAPPTSAPLLGSPPPGLAQQFKKHALQVHNDYRLLHQVPGVKWSDELASGAQAWADEMARSDIFQHSPAKTRNNIGENLAAFNASWNTMAKETVDMWYDEMKKYQYNISDSKLDTAHFTQVVWKGTTEIGMAWAQSSAGRDKYIVARYRPGGNMIGHFEKNVLPPKK